MLEWLEYLINHFFAPEGYVLNGKLAYMGQRPYDIGMIEVIDNCVNVHDYCYEHVLDTRDLKTDKGRVVMSKENFISQLDYADFPGFFGNKVCIDCGKAPQLICMPTATYEKKWENARNWMPLSWKSLLAGLA